jgi:hypothetical protein
VNIQSADIRAERGRIDMGVNLDDRDAQADTSIAV